MQHRSTTGSETKRADIEGLRAIAVGLVVLYHAGVTILPGGFVGVDVFFVISGFLITGVIVRELESSGSLNLRRFYARRLRRLLPAAILATIGSLILTYLFLPQIRWKATGLDAIWSSLYAVNWRYSTRAVDYLAAEESASPLQHYWSLAVEEQFYMAWPLLLVVAWWGAGKLKIASRIGLMVPLSVVAVASFIASVVLTSAEPRSAYFVSTTRLWELAVGGGLAIAAPFIVRTPKPAAEGLGWMGLAGIAWAASQFGSQTPFPGYAALLPVTATALVLSAGMGGHDLSWRSLLGHRWFVAIGGLSYSLYLWHWPILVAAQAALGDLSTSVGLLFVLVSLIPAWLSSVLVEQPVRNMSIFVSPPAKGLALGGLLTLSGVAAGYGLLATLPNVAQLAMSDTAAAAPDVEIVIQTASEAIVPDPLLARADLPEVYESLCHKEVGDASAEPCILGATEGPIVALVGDSHAAQWVPALVRLAEERGFQLYSYTKSSCPLAEVMVGIGETFKPYEDCQAWNQNVMTELTEVVRPDLVVVSSTQWNSLLDVDGEHVDPNLLVGRDLSRRLFEEGLRQRWSELADAGLSVVVIRDTPRPSFDVAECVGENRQSLERCAFARSRAMEVNVAQVTVAAELGVPVIDLTNWLCDPQLCPAVIDDFLVWRDAHHLTATYSLRLASALEGQFEAWPS